MMEKRRSLWGIIMLCVGFMSLGLGTLGIFLPLLPTTPFLLLALLCFAKSSDKWYRKMLYNKTFGKYLRSYKNGQGIPLAVKVWTLVLLWLTIGYSMFFLPMILWGKIALAFVAAAVTTHILHIKTARSLNSKRKILVLCAEKIELENYEPTKGVVVERIGIGAVSATFRTQKFIAKHNPDFVILAGIAGAYEDSELAVGESVIVNREWNADLGVIYEDGFRQIADCGFEEGQELRCPYADRVTGFRTAESNSVNCACFPLIKRIKGVENMEGASFFYVCLQLGIPFLELRTVSNIVEPKRGTWNLPVAQQNLARDLAKVIDQIK